ncbi:MAG TPA: HD domain-containing protein [Candidatus Methylomirabilis sp.]|nr:HD domain-containing protein [Candidatus Methylomirabilis sp.]
MATREELRAGVRKCLPEISNIKNAELREKVVEAWAYALSQSEFTSIDEIKPSGNPDTPPMQEGTQSQHLRGVAWAAQGLADGLERVHGDLGIDRDLLWACGLCHDVGKPFEFSPRNQERWKQNIGAVGFPSIRHSVYGVHVALTVGLPEAVAHTAGAHSGEGELIKRSLENTLVHFADHAYWKVMERAGRLVLPEGK